MGPHWKFNDLANFEELISRDLKVQSNESLKNHLKNTKDFNSSKARRQGLSLWFQEAQKDYKLTAGNRLSFALRLSQFLIGLFAFVSGAALVAGLIEQINIEGKGINIWKFLAFALGIQFLFLLLGGLSLLTIKLKKVNLSLVEEIVTTVLKRISGKSGAAVLENLKGSSKSYQAVLTWKISELFQVGAIWFNLGLVISLLASLLFLEIGFFWASSLEAISRPQLLNLTGFLSFPWKSFFPAGVPTNETLALTQLQTGRLNPDGIPVLWYPFLFCCLVVWGILPRLLFYLYSIFGQKRALASLTFMEARHRSIWRSLNSVEVISETNLIPKDGVIAISFEDIEFPQKPLRAFLLQKLRSNPTQWFQMGTLEGEEEQKAHRALKKAPKGIVVLVEGWNLSPKAIHRHHQHLRAITTEHSIHYVVLGVASNESLSAPSEEEFTAWQECILSLHDPETEIIQYEAPKI